MRTVSLAIAAAILISGSAAAQACQHGCGHPPAAHPAPAVVEYQPIPLPPHYVVERGPKAGSRAGAEARASPTT